MGDVRWQQRYLRHQILSEEHPDYWPTWKEKLWNINNNIYISFYPEGKETSQTLIVLNWTLPRNGREIYIIGNYYLFLIVTYAMAYNAL